MKNMKYVGLISVCFLFCLVSCSPNKVSGNGSQTPNAVVGVLYQPDGHTPAVGVRVHIRPKKTLADTSGTGLPKRTATLAATDSVVTDSVGRYAFDSTLDTGTYVVEAASGNNTVLIDSVAVLNKSATDTLAPDTLKPAGALKGVIKLSENGDPRKVFVLAFGIDRFAHVNLDGSFKFSNLAEARYDLRFVSGLDNYGVFDTLGVPVGSADTTNLDTISLPFTGIPTPKNVKIAYDTLKQIVTLSWSKADTALVKSYNVYRRNVDSNTVAVRINTSPVADTVYRDSTGVQGTTYEYLIAAVNKSATEGTKSGAVRVKVVSGFTLLKTLDISKICGNVVKVLGSSPSNDFYVLNRLDSLSGIFVLDSNGRLIDTLGFGFFKDPYDMVMDSAKNMYVCDLSKNQIIKLDSTGTLIRNWISNKSLRISLYDSLVIVGSDKEIRLFNSMGDSINSFPWSEASVKGIAVGANKHLFAYGDKTISEFTLGGLKVDSIFNTDLSQLPSYNGNGYLISAGDSTLLFILNKILYMVSEKGTLLSKLTSIGTPSSIHLNRKDGTLWIADITGSVRIFHLR
jgi:hypothetical protein